MLDFFSLALVPYPIIVFQILALLVSTAIEAWIFARKLYLPRKFCVQYALTINLASTVAVWLFGFLVQALLPTQSKLFVISYLFFQTLYTFEESWMVNLISVSGVLTIFMIVCLVEFKGIDILEAVLYPEVGDAKEESKQPFWDRVYSAIVQTDTDKLSTIFLANACSNSAILILVLIAFVQWYD